MHQPVKWEERCIYCLALLYIVLAPAGCKVLKNPGTSLVDVGKGWAGNSVNTVVFRKNSLITFRDTQYISYYDADRYVVLGKRETGSKQWQLRRTQYQGNAADAHNTISIMADGNGYLHLAWDHHNNALNYCRSKYPGSLDLTDRMPMTGKSEMAVSYPEFYKTRDGNLLFFYRDGGSGHGNLVINKYETATSEWIQLNNNLIDGEGKRNAYWQAFVDQQGTIHISWVWRESPDVSSNHDMCYARSTDGGASWEKSTGEKYHLPITAATAEYVLAIPQNSELINQTAMYADENGNPVIATYWRRQDDSIPQYHIIYLESNKWKSQSLGFRKTAFSLSGQGTKKIPVSRPQIITWLSGNKRKVMLIFRDAERGDKVSAAISDDITGNKWQLSDLTNTSVGSWEPTYDTELWNKKNILDLFIQTVEQADSEGKTDAPPQMVKVLEWKPHF